MSLWINERPGCIIFIAKCPGDKTVESMGSERLIARCRRRCSDELLYRRNLCDCLCVKETFVKVRVNQLHACFSVAFHSIVCLRNQLWACLQLTKAECNQQRHNCCQNKSQGYFDGK